MEVEVVVRSPVVVTEPVVLDVKSSPPPSLVVELSVVTSPVVDWSVVD